MLRTRNGSFNAASATAEDVHAYAEKHALTVFEVQCDKARNCSAVLRAFSRAVDYPVFFGSDMDALGDCLRETIADQKKGVLLWVHNLHSGDPLLAEDASTIMALLDSLVSWAEQEGKVFVYGVRQAGEHAPPEPGKAPRHYANHLE